MDNMLSAEIRQWVSDTLRYQHWFTLVPMPSHSDNRVFRISAGGVRYVLKFVAPKRVNAITHERAITDYLTACGFPVSHSIATTTLPDMMGIATLCSYLPGQSARVRYEQADFARRNALMDVLAALLARVHCLPLDETRDFWQYPEDRVDVPTDWATRFVQKKIASDLAWITDVLPEEMRAPFTHEITAWGQWLATAPVPLAPLHGDFYLDNVLMEDSGVTGILDWEAARLGDPMWDLARTEAAAFVDMPGAFARFLMVYAERVPWAVDANRIRRYRLLMAIGDLRYAVRYAPALISARIPVVVALWQQCREGN